MFGPHTSGSSGLVEALQRLTERLAADDLTAAEARTLRARLWGLVDSIDVGNDHRSLSTADHEVVREAERCVTV